MSAVVTGVGVVAPNGVGTREYWEHTVSGTRGIGPITNFDASDYPVRLAGEATGFDPVDHIPNRLLPQTDRVTQFALAAAEWALADARVDPAQLDPFDMGVVTANSTGGFEFGQHELENLWGRGPQYVSAYQSFAWFYAVNTGQISIRHGMRGPTGVVVGEQAGGLDALAQARRRVRSGTRLLVSGGMEAPLCPWAVAAQSPNRRISRSDDPERAYRPFAAGASGYVLGEGGAILIVEDPVAARRRGAPVYGEIAGYRATFDPRPGSGRPPSLETAVRGALEDARTLAADIDVVFADAAGVSDLDLIEARAIASVFGAATVPVTAPKTMTGRLNAGGAALDVATALLAIRDGIIPPTVNHTGLAGGCDIDLVTEARPARIRTALVIARGHGGFNAAMVVRAPR
ncbi:ketosynthase chain-length factor [Nocardiopsis mangrovi]|uniref:Ketosynthase chain-length factor n=1 Tax=Nocardiopsis mangrovi TaxID=1179818 RepID=A0ABV9DVM6_9ACTN